MGSTRDSTTEAERISDGLCQLNVFVVDKPENSGFDVLFPSTTVKRSPAVDMFTCSYCIFIIKLIIYLLFELTSPSWLLLKLPNNDDNL